MTLARNLRRSEKLRKQLLITRTVPETPAAKGLRKVFLESAVPQQLKDAAIAPPMILPKVARWRRWFQWLFFWKKRGET